MKIYKKWTEIVSNEGYQDFFMKYLEVEKQVYIKILSSKTKVIYHLCRFLRWCKY